MGAFIVASLLFLCASSIDASNILIVIGCLSGSHHLWLEKLAVNLVEVGHNVTMLSHDQTKLDHIDYHLLYIPGSYEKVQHGFAMEDLPNQDDSFSAEFFYAYMEQTNKVTRESDALKFLLSYPKEFKFDMILFDVTGGEALFPIAGRFGNPPVIGISPFGVQPYIHTMMGNPLLSYIPFYMKHYRQPMSLWQRLQNVYNMLEMLYVRQKYVRRMMADSRRAFGDNIGTFEDFERNMSLVLANYDPNFDTPQPLPPNVIPVGGLQGVTPKPLPKDLAEIYEKDTKGIVYFSLGTNLRSEKVDKTILDAFIGCFAKLDHTVLWKIKDLDVKLPKNVYARPWMPQNDILAHPKTKVFISHGGLLSSQESILHGVPIIILPFFVDQFSNADKYEDLGYARQLNYHKITETYVCETLKEVLYNNKNDQHRIFRCWSVVQWFDTWKKTLVYGPLAALPIVFPHKLWLSYVAGGQLISLAAFHLLLSFKGPRRRRRKDRLLHPEIDSYESSRFEEVTEVLDDGLPEPMPGSSHSLSDSLAEQDTILEI